MLQEQMDATNEEICSEQQAEEADSRAAGARLGSLRRFKSLNSLNLCPDSSLAGSCPPSRERSLPRRRRHSPTLQGDPLGGDRLGVMTPLPTIIKGETSSPASPRSLRLDQLHAGALSSTISQDSLHKAVKKKGIKSRIGRLFGKKTFTARATWKGHLNADN
ncbi:hypothetical protein FD754_011669 [Muntiacus muntjak]|uniref:Uncharacterized protein n=1 Tax=Muntiacus muntjak TaxID=9888 RepID=A0A5N3VCH6_MUNMU|nr:hypothetical protein FD754_011669 [Muntiacus muntjak]